MAKNSKQRDTNENELPEVRLDKWLWAARFFKTRSLAKDTVAAGKVQYNGAKAKPGRIVEPGAIIKVPQGFDEKIITVLRVSEQRLSAPLAQQLYEETRLSAEKRAENAAARKLNAFHSPRPEQRPDKKQRREIIKLKHS